MKNHFRKGTGMENFEQMTVIELRKYAREHEIRLPAGIDKKGIVEKLSAAAAAEDAQQELPVQTSVFPVNEAEPSSILETHPIRKASIITDDVDESDDDDDGSVFQSHRVLRSAVVSPVGAKSPSASTSSLSSISSKAPAFTMEGTRAWHNPRTYNPVPPAQSYARTQWTTKPVSSQDSPYNGRGKEGYASKEASVHRSTFIPQEGTNVSAPAPAPSSQIPEKKFFTYQDPYSGVLSAQEHFAVKENALRPAANESAAPTKEMLLEHSVTEGAGFLEIQPEGYGYLRGKDLLPGRNDILVSHAQIRRFELRRGDLISGTVRARQNDDPFSVLLTVSAINGVPSDQVEKRARFEELSPLYPKRIIRLENAGTNASLGRVMDLMCPIGFGQRALIRTPDTFDTKSLLGPLSHMIAASAPEAALYFLCLSETPEENELYKSETAGSFIGVPFGTAPEAQVQICDTLLENAMRNAEIKKDTIILVNDLSRLAEGYHLCSPQSSRVLFDELSAAGIAGAKRFFAAARNTREGGSITIICVSPVSSRLGDEFRASANMLMQLDEEMILKKIDPPISMKDSCTRHGEIMQSREDRFCADGLKEFIISSDPGDAMQQLLFMFDKAATNAELAEKLGSWLKMLKHE